jgi:hypothetical protein
MDTQTYWSNKESDVIPSSALNRIPTEILCEIVYAYLLNEGDITSITHINSHLRQVVFQMPRVWSSILLLPARNQKTQYVYRDVRLSLWR